MKTIPRPEQLTFNEWIAYIKNSVKNIYKPIKNK